MNITLMNKITGSAALLFLLIPQVSIAQQPGGPGGFGQAPPPMFDGQGQRDGQRPPRPESLSAASIPVSTLSFALKLSDDQRTKIAALQSKLDSLRKESGPPDQMSNHPRPGAGFGGGPGMGGQQGQGFGQPPMPNGEGGGGPRGGGDIADDMDSFVSDKIVALLNSSQQQSLTKLIHTLRDLRLVGISPETYSDLNLTDSQISKIADLANSHREAIFKAIDSDQSLQDVQQQLQSLHRKLHTDTMAILTDDQAAIVKSHQPGPGRRGGQGGPNNGPDGFGPPPGGPRGGDQGYGGQGFGHNPPPDQQNPQFGGSSEWPTPPDNSGRQPGPPPGMNN
jgi:hypothetical protein